MTNWPILRTTALRKRTLARSAITHVSPTASAPEQVAKVEEAKLSLQESELWAWAWKPLETGALGEQFTPGDAIALAKSIDSETLFTLPEQNGEEPGMRRGAVASVAAIALNFRQSFNQADLDWARVVLKRALLAPESRGPGWFYAAIIPWHHAIFVARGLAADHARQPPITILVVRSLALSPTRSKLSR